ncbi:fimbrial protein [Bacteroides sp. GM023]|uniref:fimbrial protein n=1 Tax=Bacteroides sp. GM023 TaxID=2723058 RepID=UPI00168A9E2A|nr:fimbrial protein [Bacteroides sp. GM023]MBD3589616.1 hypothetical protein [Bacteroides sp. GM023]
MKLRMKYLHIACLFLFSGLTACSEEDNISGQEIQTGESEQIVLKLSVPKESVVQTRAAADTPNDDEKVERIDFLVFDDNKRLVWHEQPTVKWTGIDYKMTVSVPSYKGKHQLYLVANYPMTEEMIPDLDALLAARSKTLNASVASPFVMSTRLIELSNLNATTIGDAMKTDGGAFKLWRNVAKFSVSVSATNFSLTSVNWINCSAEAPVVYESDYEVSSKSAFQNIASPASPVFLYNIPDYGTNKPNQSDGFYVVIGGEYTAKDGTKTAGFYKIRLFTLGADSKTKVPLSSIDSNKYYKIDVKSVFGAGLNSLNMAKKNGFSNDMEALTFYEYKGSHDYRENFLQNGYQLGMEKSHLKIYNGNYFDGLSLGYFYRCIRDASLGDYTILDPDYPNKNRGRVKAYGVGTDTSIILASTQVYDKPDSPIEMELRFTDDKSKFNNSNIIKVDNYTINSILQYGTIRKEMTIDRYRSIPNIYTVLTMQNTSNAEVVGDATSWVGIAEQRHEGVTTYPKIDSENAYIFIHVKANNTGQPRDAVIRLFGKDGYYEVHLRQKA